MTGLRFTDKDETLDVFNRLEERYGVGTQIRPVCTRERRKGESEYKTECGATTEYVVEPCVESSGKSWSGRDTQVLTTEIRSVGVLLNLVPVSVASYLDGALYIPMRICLRCGAASDGYRDGKAGLGNRPKTSSLSPEDKSTYLQAYIAAWTTGLAAGEAVPDAKKTKDRYRAAAGK